jgi:hypothetical protein
VFGRHKREIKEAAEAAREADRRALFEELAKRPDTVCPFLGLAQARAEYHDGVTDEHRCYAFGDPAELSAEQQHKVCLQRGYGNCPRYLRGVLVIPTEELEALRRPHPAPPIPPPQRPVPQPVAAGDGGRRRGLVAVVLILLLAVGGGGAAFVLLNDDGVAQQTPSPTPSEPAVSNSLEPSSTSIASESPVATPTPEPTPAPADVFAFYEVAVDPGVAYTLYEVDDATGAVVGSRPAEFANFSQARVEALERADGSGVVHWRTSQGDYFGLSYIYDPGGPIHSGPFRIRAVYRTPEGTRSSEYLPEDELSRPLDR